MSAANKLTNGDFNINIADNVLSNFEGIISTKPMAKYASGARCVLRINGKLVGFAFNITWNIITSVTEIRTIDDYLPYELVPKHVVVNGTIGALHIPGAGASADQWQADVLNFLQQKYITIEVRDSQSDNLLFFTNKAMVVSKQEVLQVEQLSQVTLSWQAVGFKEEREPKKVRSQGESPLQP